MTGVISRLLFVPLVLLTRPSCLTAMLFLLVDRVEALFVAVVAIVVKSIKLALAPAASLAIERVCRLPCTLLGFAAVDGRLTTFSVSSVGELSWC